MTTITEIEYLPVNGFADSYLKLNFKNTNKKIVNTIRRLCLDYVPMYAFARELIKIDKNTSIYTNDVLTLRMSNFRIPNLNVDIDYLPIEYWKYIDFLDTDRLKHKNDNQVIEMYVNYKNDTNDIVNVTTNNSSIYINGEEVQLFDKKYPDLILKLKPKEEINLSCFGALSIGKRSVQWSSSNVFFEQLDDNQNNYDITIESVGQFNEYDILLKCCEIIKGKLQYLYDLLINDVDIKNEKNTDGSEITIIIENEDFTIGGILEYYLQNIDSVVFAGLIKPDLSVDEITLKLKTNKPILTVIKQAIDNINSEFDTISKQITNLKKKNIKK